MASFQRGQRKPRLRREILLVTLILLGIVLIIKENVKEKGGNSSPGEETPSSPQKMPLDVFIGIQSGCSNLIDGPGTNDYAARRKSIRLTWTKNLENGENSMLVYKFFIGTCPEKFEAKIREEHEIYMDIIRLPIDDTYQNLVKKTRTYFGYALKNYPAKYYVKVDDDVYLTDYITGLKAIKEWSDEEADYIGCMKTGQVYTQQIYKWYEPQHDLLGTEYFAHAWGSIYVLSSKAVHTILSTAMGSLREFKNEDVTIGAWMLAFNVNHKNDRRLCQTACTEDAIAVWDYPWPGLKSVDRMYEVHAACSATQTE